MNILTADNLTVSYGKLKVVDDVSFSVDEGQWLVLAGPNGAGKSTIVNAISGETGYSGRISFKGNDMALMRSRELAGCVGVLTQNHAVGYDFTVEEVVELGRYSHKKTGSVYDACRLVGLEDKMEQSVLTLSGGELQRTFLAQLIVQDPAVMILDEPSNHLDPVYQKQVFEIIKGWLKTPGRAVISVIHDLSLAKAYSSHSMLLRSGRCLDIGETEKVLSKENLIKAYDMDVYNWLRDMLKQWDADS